jgi:hypothetical protein
MQQPHHPAAPDRPRVRRRPSAAVFGGLILLFFVAALFARGFSREVGDARVAGRYSLLPLFHSRVPDALALTWNGLTLRFGRAATPALRGFEAAGGSTDIVFDGGGRLRLSPGADTGGSITITPVESAGAAGGSSAVTVSFSVEGVIESPPPGAALAWKRAGREFLLALPGEARTDMAGGTLTLPLAAGSSAVLQVQGVAAAARPAQTVTEAPRLPRESAMPAEGRLRASVAAWADSAWQGWSVSRYSAAGGTWQLADGSAGFSEDIGTGLLAESISRGTWQTAFPQWADALARQQQKGGALDFVSSAYVGGARDFARSWRAETSAQVGQAAAALARSEASVLAVPDLVTLLLDHGTPDLVQGLGAWLARKTPESLDLSAAIGYAQAVLDYQRLVRADDALARLLKDVVETRILPSVRTVDSGVFLDTGGGKADIRSSIRCGALLIRAGTLMGSTLAQAVGRGLVVSSLQLADDKGFLPATISLSGGRVASRDGSLAPEAVYGSLPLDRYVPRETPIGAAMGPGAWVWSSARVASTAGSVGGIALVFSYPRGVPYHLVLGGMRPFTLLKLHGIPWHSDAAYFKYSDGWDYDPETRTLFMKVTGRGDQEEIDITW